MKDTPASVSDLKPELPRELARIIRHCLAKDPEDRYQTAKDIRTICARFARISRPAT
jgi:serine/threonine protein kinase